jgi:uncharacterized RDD family membrane protein YckC
MTSPSTPPVVAPLGRRFVALAVDWVACLVISAAVAPTAGGLWLTRGDPWVTLAVFAVENVVLVAFAGNTLGHRLVGLRVQQVPRGTRPGPAVPGLTAGAVRALLLCLVIPAVVWTADGRGLHDVAARTVIVRR